MGVLTVGEPLSWEDSQEHLKYVRSHGVLQFLATYERHKGIRRDELLYGDEIEYGIFRMDALNKTSMLSLRGAEVRDALEEREVQETSADSGKCTWHPEYGAWMVESTPAEPYSGFAHDLRRIEVNMRARRARLIAALDDDEIAPTVVVYPMLGVPGTVEGDVRGPIANSAYLPDSVINPHPRFGALTRNIRQRRGGNVDIHVPMFKDEHTPVEAVEEGIHMDAMAFGMGCCCLQVTFQCRDVDESRHVYDQLAVLAPIMLALTAATPIVKGKLQDWDVRWDMIEGSVDCRTPAERRGKGEPTSQPANAHMAGDGVRPIRTSRYSGVSSYMCEHKECALHCPASFYNDVDLEVDEASYATLRAAGLDDLLAKHVAHLFIRDPLVCFRGMISELDDSVATDHFENLQSTNWNSVRWKPPPAQSKIGWRVELRSMEVQLTDFENAAFTVFSTLALRVLLSFDLDIYVPISKVQQNMTEARGRDAATDGAFWWRSHLATPNAARECQAYKSEKCSVHSDEQRVERMSAYEILAGKKGYYPGLVPLILAYLEFIDCDHETTQQVKLYLDVIVKRSSGELLTPAKWMRNFVQTHPDYNGDSDVPASVAHDLLDACHKIGVGTMAAPDLLGDIPIRPIVKANAYNVQLSRLQVDSNEQLTAILDRYAERARLVERRAALQASSKAKQVELDAIAAELREVEAEMGIASQPRRVSSASSLHRESRQPRRGCPPKATR
ncbi:glutamate-cysteine ligase-domain-containing protein [Pelagophyceae sp. CCMP2097]|nr:glutamate-cysteine ligase-domain-containing protein [Pelagophyceae sp. CCMP2097]